MRETDSERKKGKGVGKGQKEILVHSEWKEGKQMRRCVPLHVQKKNPTEKKAFRERCVCSDNFRQVVGLLCLFGRRQHQALTQ